MTRRRPITVLASGAVIPLVALAVAACGGGSAATAASSKPAASKPAAPKPATPTTMLRVANTRLGRILVNSNGRTLYLFKADVGTMSTCTGACATAWPPLLAPGNVTAGSGLTASKLGTTARSNGTKQVTYNGHPLYLFIMDKKAGDTNGQGVNAFGAAWFAVSPAGNQISSKPAAHGGGSSSPRPAAPTTTATTTAPPPAAKPAPKPASPPVVKPKPPASNGIPQNGGGDDDSDNHGGPSDGDGNI